MRTLILRCVHSSCRPVRREGKRRRKKDKNRKDQSEDDRASSVSAAALGVSYAKTSYPIRIHAMQCNAINAMPLLAPPNAVLVFHSINSLFHLFSNASVHPVSSTDTSVRARQSRREKERRHGPITPSEWKPWPSQPFSSSLPHSPADRPHSSLTRPQRSERLGSFSLGPGAAAEAATSPLV